MKKIVLIVMVAVLTNINMDKPLCANAKSASGKISITATETISRPGEEIAGTDFPMLRLTVLY